ncbi:MAG: 50S ribosomal protein L24 [Anaerolineales bacterium]|nr:50S ribosomal protein L24 [Anaerolineales bacterium]
MKIKRGDTVIVIRGNDKGLQGTVQRVIPNSDRIVVNSINIIKKHQKPVQTGGRSKTQPGIIEYEAPIHVSTVKLICPSCNKPTRVGYAFDENGDKRRICKNCDADF